MKTALRNLFLLFLILLLVFALSSCYLLNGSQKEGNPQKDKDTATSEQPPAKEDSSSENPQTGSDETTPNTDSASGNPTGQGSSNAQGGTGAGQGGASSGGDQAEQEGNNEPSDGTNENPTMQQITEKNTDTSSFYSSEDEEGVSSDHPIILPFVPIP